MRGQADISNQAGASVSDSSRMPNSGRLLTLVAALLLATLAPVSAQKATDLDSATIADLNAAFNAGSLTAERLAQLCLARIQAYDRQGPALRAVIAINPKALETARMLDAERKNKGPRSPLHGIPVVLKDNFDTADMPTTGGSIRGPSTANGIVGLKPTHGLLSRDGIIPLALSFDTGGPMARSVYDVAATLGVMTGVDAADAATKKSGDRFDTDYTKYLKTDALKGARIGIARDFLGVDADVDWVIDAALDAMRRAGVTVVDVRFPKWLLDARADLPKDHRSVDRACHPRERLACGRCGSEPRPMGRVEARSGKRDAGRLPIHFSARPCPANGARGGRRPPHVAEARRDRLSDIAAPAGAHRRATRCPRRRSHFGGQPRQPHRLPRPGRAGRIHG